MADAGLSSDRGGVQKRYHQGQTLTPLLCLSRGAREQPFLRAMPNKCFWIPIVEIVNNLVSGQAGFMDLGGERYKLFFEGFGDWDLIVPKTVYPPREDSILLAESLIKIGKIGETAMEIGCGSGAISIILNKLGYDVKCCDVNPLAVATTTGNLKNNNIYDVEIIETGLDDGLKFPKKTDLITWNLPYMVSNDYGEILDHIEDASFLDIEEGWSNRLLENIEQQKERISDGCIVVLLFRTYPDSPSNPSLWTERGWASRVVNEMWIGDEKLEVIMFWRPGRGEFPILVDDCTSTMDEIDEFEEGMFTRLYTLNQTDGRGRKGSKWQSTVGDLTATWKIRMNMARKVSPGIIQISIGAMISRVLNVGLKWPNDLVTFDGRKLGGVLIESDDSKYMKVGVGINREKNNKKGLEVSGYLETIGDINQKDLFGIIDLEMASKFEEIGNYGFLEEDALITDSWKVLSKILSRGVKLTDSINDFRIIGLNEFGELEIQDGKKSVSEVIRDVDNNLTWII